MRFLPVLILLCFSLRAGESDALAIDATIQARHVPYGTVLNPIFAAPGSQQIVNYTRCGDSAIWTGHYVAAEAYRYRVTKSAEALANLRRAVAGIRLLVDVTGSDLLARCALPQDAPFAAGVRSEEVANGIHDTILNGKPWMWVGHTSRDQYTGVFFGLGVAYDLIEDSGIRADAAAIITRLLDRLLQWGWNVTMPDGSLSTTFLIRPEQQLSFLQVGKRVNPQQFADRYARDSAALAVNTPLPLNIDALSDRSSYFKFNLDFITLYNLIRLETDSGLKAFYEEGFLAIRRTTNNHLNAHFNMIDRALHGPDRARDQETRANLAAWLQRPRTDVFVDLRGRVEICGGDACRPLPVEQRPPSDFVWQINPFQLTGGGGGVIETAGIDYILPYWMARYYRVIRGPATSRRPR